ncbi:MULTISPECIES: hypothetical protein [unclassified Streptomyces]|uniref:hypothetical protein n=1 Tax=unclassified Streptomyces TaxID=2593676 RepID=UPI001BEA7233|nr:MULTISPECIES: hypothetical protein [unclassified Streptomyces]MBT2402709.1 hypothetical protein [Streptomyces sp. ISL-21]MBT2606852.1 hypothetical protein [Streptomyces sp. ISL-87]
MGDEDMVGMTGRVTGTVGPGLVGEVIVRIRGGAEHFLAHPVPGTAAAGATQRLPVGTMVTVVEYQPPRTVYVMALYDI